MNISLKDINSLSILSFICGIIFIISLISLFLDQSLFYIFLIPSDLLALIFGISALIQMSINKKEEKGLSVVLAITGISIAVIPFLFLPFLF